MLIPRLLPLLAAALLAGCSASAPSPGDDAASGVAPAPPAGTSREATVERVVDGDTIVVLVAGRRARVRLSGIDTPETVKPGSAVECFGPEASREAGRLLDGQAVRLDFDVETSDRYGRWLAYVVRRADGRLVNEDLLRGGFAERFRDTPNRRHLERFVAAERAARREGAGLWSACRASSAR